MLRALAVTLAIASIAGAVAWAVLSETPRGDLIGVVIAEELGRPIPDAKVTLAWAHGSDRGTRTDEDGRFCFEGIEAGSYRVFASAQAHAMESPRAVTVDESATTELTLELPPENPFLTVGAPTGVFTTQEEPQLRLRGFTTLGALEMTIYRVDIEAALQVGAQNLGQLLGLGDSDRALWKLDHVPRLSRVERRSLDIIGRDPEGVFTMRLDLPLHDPGIYVVALRNDEVQAITPVTITDLALVCKWTDGALVAWAVDIASGEPREGVEVRVRREQQPVASATTDADGIAEIPVEIAGERGRTLVNARDGQSFASIETWLWSWGESGNRLRVYTYTDRPAYRPGHEVHFKGIVRRMTEDGYEVTEGAPVKVQVRDDMDNLIYTTELRTGDFGSFHGSLMLPEEATPGIYALKTAVAGEPHYADFIVSEYRKPEWEVEVTTGQDRYVRGDEAEVTAEARYFYGAPVADATVTWTVTRTRWWYWPGLESFEEQYGYYEDYGDGGELVAKGGGITDSAGRCTFTVPTTVEEADEANEWEAADYLYRVEVTVRDPSRREVSASHRFPVMQGQFRLRVQPDPSVLRVDEPTEVTISAIDHEGDPVQTSGDIRLELSDWSGSTERFERRASEIWRTNASGEATVTFAPREPGSYRVTATAEDSHGNRIVASSWLWVTQQTQFAYDYPYGELDLVPDRQSYDEGEIARILVNTELVPATALVTIEAEEILSRRLVELTTNSTMVEVPLQPEWAPNCRVNVTFVRDKQFISDGVELQIAPESRKLEIAVESDRAQYGPGDEATFTVRATRPDGTPARAELSLGVVDEALYALYPDHTTPIVDAFFPRRDMRVRTDFSFARVYLSSAEKAGVQIATRRRFEDTAFWQPSAVTDDSGLATFRFRLPDNLTTWRATVRGHTRDTVVGQQTHTALVTKPLLVRLASPRFITQGDTLRLAAVVHNRTGDALQVRSGLDAAGLEHEAETRSGTVTAGQARRFEWEVTAPDVGEARVRVWAQSDSLSDAMELTIPVLPRGRHRVEQRSGTVEGRVVESLPIRADAIERASSATLRLTPSLASAMLGSLEYLAEYPYGCVEQTTSTFLPDVIIARMLDRLGLEAPDLRQRLPGMVQNGLLRLYDFQHDDGGWGWWGYDGSDPWMTAYVLYALTEARDAGFEVNDYRLTQGRLRLADLYVADRLNVRTRAWAALALARSGSANTVRRGGGGIEGLVQRTRSAPADVRANVCLALAALDERDRALQLLDALWAEAEVSPELIHWEASGEDYWWSLDSEATARVLSAAARLTPDDPRLPKVVRWLLLERRGNHWHATRDTAFVLRALADYLPITGEATPDFTATVTIDGVSVLSRRFTADDVVSPEVVVEVPPDRLRPGASVSIEIDREGRGLLYYTLTLDQYVREDLMRPVIAGTGVTLDRTYRLVRTSSGSDATEPLDPDRLQVHSGDVVEVTLQIESGREHEYMVLEDPIPAGCEIIERGRIPSWEWQWWWSDQIVRDELMAFALRTLPAEGRTLVYRLKAQIPGHYVAMPSTVYNMYDPSVRSTGRAHDFTILP